MLLRSNLSRKARTLCSRLLQKRCCMLGKFRPALDQRRYNSNWRDEIADSEVLFRHEMEVPRIGMLDLLSACNTIVKSKFNEDEPERKEAIITIYGKQRTEKTIEDLRNIVERMHKYKSLVRHKFTGTPPMIRVEFPYLQKHREELEHCMTLVVEMPYQYGMIAKVTENANLFIKDFENEYTSGYADRGQIELSKIRSTFNECFSGGDIICKDYLLGSGYLWTMLTGGIYVKKLQGINWALHTINGNLETESVYCSDLVYTNEQGDVTTGLIQATGCHFETHNGQLKVDSVTADNTVGRIYKSGKMDIVIEKTTEMYLYHGEGGEINLKIGEGVEIDMEIQSKSSSISSQIKFDELEKYSDPIRKYQVTKGKLGKTDLKWDIENHEGHVILQKGDWMSSMKRKIPNLNV